MSQCVAVCCCVVYRVAVCAAVSAAVCVAVCVAVYVTMYVAVYRVATRVAVYRVATCVAVYSGCCCPQQTRVLSSHTHINQSRHLHSWVESHIRMIHITHMNDLCHTYKWVMSHMILCHNEIWGDQYKPLFYPPFKLTTCFSSAKDAPDKTNSFYAITKVANSRGGVAVDKKRYTKFSASKLLPHAQNRSHLHFSGSFKSL